MPGVIAFIHVLVRPNAALGYNGFTLIAMVAILRTGEQNYDTQIFHRLLVASFISIVVLQLVMRFWRRLLHRVSVVTTDMSKVVQQLDIERATAQREAREALLIEPASGLFNRDGFLAALGEHFRDNAVDHAKPVGLIVAIRFPGWVDATSYLGLTIQDNLLCSLIARLKNLLGADALLARSGNEDYLAWIPGSVELPTALLTNSLLRHTHELDLAVTSGTFSVSTRLRIGMSRAPDDGCTADILVADAELALMNAVRQFKSEPVLFTSQLLVDTEERHLLIRDLEVAVAAGDFALHYQPVLSVSGKEPPKAEALIRWKHPQRGYIAPDIFIPLAEQAELINDITDWVFRQVAFQVKLWRKTLHPQLQISINMPPAYLLLCAREPQRMLAKLDVLNLPHQSVLLEITEGIMLDVTPELLNAITMLRSLGFMIAMDDFGIGYSSFGQLCKLKLDFVKLDKTFIRDLDRLPRQQAICRAIIQMAHELDCKVVAEGVETDDERNLLQKMNADYLQGYLFCRPMPAEEFHAWATERWCAG